MRSISAIASLTVLLCVLATQHAHAFEQQSIFGSAAQTNEPNTGKQSSSESALQELVGSSSSSKGMPNSDGQSISIPGLGTVGVLPEMDFGLELLYGDKASEEVLQEREVGESEDLRIRGSIKHRF